jgi:DnaJ-class molecular chaperone
MDSKDYYDILELPKNSNINDIKKKYKQLALKWHPDRNKEANAESKFKEISEAYEILGDPEKKQIYDNNINVKNKIQFNNPFDIFNHVFKERPNTNQNNLNTHFINVQNLNRQSNTFSINLGASNVMSSSRSTSCTIVNGELIENITIKKNGIITKIIRKNGQVISKILTDSNNVLINEKINK